MNRVTIGIACLLAFVVLSLGDSAPVRTFQGEIADSQCSLNVHSLTRSHQEMLKSKAMGGSSLSCTLYCIRYLGGELVLSSKKDVYRLDDQGSAKKFIGMKVRVTGSLDSKAKTIHVTKITLREN